MTARPTSVNSIAKWKASDTGFGGSLFTSQTTRVWPFRRAREQIQVKSAGLSAPLHQRRNHHPVDRHEPAITPAEPQKIGAIVSSPLIEGDEERISVADLSRIESHLSERFQLPRIEP